MKQSQNSGGTRQSQTSGQRVENKDSLDSRHKEEEMVKGNHITNNEKSHHSLGRQKQSQN